MEQFVTIELESDLNKEALDMIKETPYVVETEKNITLTNTIKNRLNPYILSRMDKLGDKIPTEEWLDETEEGCNILIQDLNLRKTLARQHMVNYILQERGASFFGVNNLCK